MSQVTIKQKVQIAVLVLFASITAYASASGPDPGYTNAPGDLGNCTACHDHHLVNEGSGSVRINGLPNFYEPGHTYTFTATTAQSGRVKFGFQLTVIDSQGNRAGTLANLDSNTQVLTQTGAGGRQYIEHTSQGTFANGAGSRTWQLRWTAPDVDIGPVRFYVAGNATDNSGFQDDNDFIYTNSQALDSPTTYVTVSLHTAMGGLVLPAGSHQTLDWDVTGLPNVDNIELRYSTDDGATFPITQLILATTVAETNTVDWTVPNTPSTHSLIRVLVGKKSGDAVQALSGKFTITGDGSGPVPIITGVQVNAKKLFVFGSNFAMDAVVEVDGVEVGTVNDGDDPTHFLRCKKGAKRVAPGETGSAVVRNPNGTTSQAFSFIRPL